MNASSTYIWSFPGDCPMTFVLQKQRLPWMPGLFGQSYLGSPGAHVLKGDNLPMSLERYLMQYRALMGIDQVG